MKTLFLSVLLIGCGVVLKEYTTTTFYNKMFTQEQFDSICNKEGVHLDSMPLKVDSKYLYEYYGFKDSLVIRGIKDGDSIQVTKRINK